MLLQASRIESGCWVADVPGETRLVLSAPMMSTTRYKVRSGCVNICLPISYGLEGAFGDAEEKHPLA